jgi:hypothetical protein
MMQRFFHGTSPAAWDAIQQEGVLWGKRDCGPEYARFAPNRCTYLTDSQEIAARFGDVVLRVWYDPDDGFKRNICNRWDKDCWQFRIYEPILLCWVTRVI